MKTHSNRMFLITVLLVVVQLIAACGGQTASYQGPNTGGTLQQGEIVKSDWTTLVGMELDASGQFKKIEQGESDGFQAIKTNYPLIDQCYKNTDKVIRDALDGMFDIRSSTVPTHTTGAVNAQGLQTALILNPNYPDTSKCAEIMQGVMKDVKDWRSTRTDQYNKLWDMQVHLDFQYHGDQWKDVQHKLGAYVQQQAVAQGIKWLPQYTFPTFNLKAISHDEALCTEATTMYPSVEWHANGNWCELIGQSAYNYMFRPVLAAEVQNSHDTGVDNMNPLSTPAP